MPVDAPVTTAIFPANLFDVTCSFFSSIVVEHHRVRSSAVTFRIKHLGQDFHFGIPNLGSLRPTGPSAIKIMHSRRQRAI
jgi:hypothetical protein